jgi:DAK2 domain fusion protein YloV
VNIAEKKWPGKIEISPDAVMAIVGQVIMECYGVVGMADTRPGLRHPRRVGRGSLGNGNAVAVQQGLSTRKLCTGRELKLLLEAGSIWLEKHVLTINALNVYPVPDGDTGTNMLLTMQAALRDIDNAGDPSSVAVVAQAAAQGALMGARGNSGVILSQLLRGFACALDGKDSFDARDLVAAVQEASATAYKGIIKPVEGTILTVAHDAASAVVVAAESTDDLHVLLERALEAAKAAVAMTPELLPVLKEAGVADAGGQGLAIILEGALRFLRGETLEAGAATEATVDLRLPFVSGKLEYGYDVQFALKGQGLNVDEVRAAIDSMGESTLVVGDSNLVKVHVHVRDPGEPLSYAVSLGTLSEIIVENMDEQYRGFIGREVRPPVAVPVPKAQRRVEGITDIATVAVVNGAGLVRIFESLGISAIVPGGQSMNPSTEELLEAIESLEARNVVVLPNNSNVIPTARQARELSTKQVRVVPTRTIPQGISALLAFNFQADLDTNVGLMEQAVQSVQTIEVTRAVRPAQFNDLQAREGDVIGLVNDTLVASGSEPAAVILAAMKRFDMDSYEIVTIYYGEGIRQDQADVLAKVIEDRYPAIETEVRDGTQPYYLYIVSIE